MKGLAGPGFGIGFPCIFMPRVLVCMSISLVAKGCVQQRSHDQYARLDGVVLKLYLALPKAYFGEAMHTQAAT